MLRVVWASFRGRWTDNPRVLHEAMGRQGGDVEHIWLADPGAVFPPGLTTVPFRSAACIEALESADLVVANDCLSFEWAKRPDAVYLQTWHGTPLKRMFRDARWTPDGQVERMAMDVARWDVLLSPNHASTPLLRSAFGFDGHVAATGYPRNDVLLAPDRARHRAVVRRRLGIRDGVTAVLYTPTWRDDAVFDTGRPSFSLQLDVEDFTARLGPDHVLLVRAHSMASDALEPIAGMRDVSGHPDVAELYLAADVMVTDYSSTMFDFALTGKPLLFFTYDLEHYRDRLRGFYVELADIAPGPLLSTSTEVVDALTDLDRVTAEHAGAYARFRATYCSLEDGRATGRVLDLLSHLLSPEPRALTATTARTTRARATTPIGGDHHAFS